MVRSGVRRTVAAGACALLVTSLTASPASPQSKVRRCSNGLVALTFDDGPARAVTGDLLDVLVAHRAPATFFVVGERVAVAPWLARRADRDGFVVANHTYHHETLTRLSDGAVRATLRNTARELRDSGVVPSSLMRPPYGLIDRRVRSVVEGMGLTPVLWDVDPRDWEPATPDQLADRVLRGLTPGGRNIVLLHDGVRRSRNTLRAVPAILRRARHRGYCFAVLGAGGNPVPPVPRVRVSDARLTEPGPGEVVTLGFRLRLDHPTSRAVSVRVRTENGSAVAGRDYEAVRQRVQLPAGKTSRTVGVRVLGDRVDETGERLRLLLDEPHGLRVEDGWGVGTIVDDDPRPRLTLADASVVEPESGTTDTPVRLRLDRPSSRRVVVWLATVAGTADATDYDVFERTVAFEPGSTRVEVSATVLADTVDEDVETFTVQVVTVRRATVADGSATVAIDPPSPAEAPPSG